MIVEIGSWWYDEVFKDYFQCIGLEDVELSDGTPKPYMMLLLEDKLAGYEEEFEYWSEDAFEICKLVEKKKMLKHLLKQDIQ